MLYNGYNFRIMDKGEEYTKLILDGYIKNEDNEEVKVSYDRINNYLDNNFINKFNKDELVKVKYVVNEYNINNDYNYSSVVDEFDEYYAIPKISDMFISDYSDIWLNTYNNRSQDLIYKTTDNASMIADLEDEDNYIRVVIAIRNDLIISGGVGTKNDPYRIGDNE